MPRAASPRRPLSLVCALVVALLAVALATAAGPAAAAPQDGPPWRLLDTGTTNHFRGLAVVDRNDAWLGGYRGQVLRTTDGGATWTDVSPTGPGVKQLQFRDIAASDRNHAVAMAAGSGTDSRLYVTADGGASWRLAYKNAEPSAFFDCMSFSDAAHGLVLSDPVGGRFRVLATADGGVSWTVVPAAGVPPAQPGEAGFAASGQCLTTVGSDAWFGSGGGATARVYHSGDGGRTWSVTTTPLVSDPTGGVFGLAFRTASRGIVVGGDFARPAGHARVAATQLVGGAWTLSSAMPHGYRSGVTFVPGTVGTVLAVGLTGSDVSTDSGKTWSLLDTGQFDTVTCAPDGSCWAAGDVGRVAVLQRL